jgi:hypothetical protein
MQDRNPFSVPQLPHNPIPHFTISSLAIYISFDCKNLAKSAPALFIIVAGPQIYAFVFSKLPKNDLDSLSINSIAAPT